jgi:hypothetical protein
MALNFPDSPSVNDLFTSGNSRWQWNGSSWVRRGNMVALLIEAVKEQNEVINTMRKEIDELKKKLGE